MTIAAHAGAPPRRGPLPGGPTVRPLLGPDRGAPVAFLPAGGGLPEHDHGPSHVALIPLHGQVRLHHDGTTRPAARNRDPHRRRRASASPTRAPTTPSWSSWPPARLRMIHIESNGWGRGFDRERLPMTHQVHVQVRRVYDTPEHGDGARVLVDRIWPRGLTKTRAELRRVVQAVAPSTELRKWYSHDPDRFAEFTRRYQVELAEPERSDALAHLRELANERTVDLAHRDETARDQ